MTQGIRRRSLLQSAAAVAAVATSHSLLWPAAPAAADGSRTADGGPAIDTLDFGDTSSEKAHSLRSEASRVTDGALGDSARVASPLSPAQIHGGDLRFVMKVDPVRQNYLTVKFWGSDSSTLKTVAYINSEQIGYRRYGDYSVVDDGSAAPLPGRFYYSTILLPLAHTQGQSRVEIMLRSYDSGYTNPVKVDSRGYYKAYTHTTAALDLSSERQADYTPPTTTATDVSEARKQELLTAYTKTQQELHDKYAAKVDAGQKLSIVRYQDELRFYSMSLLQSWSPTQNTAQRKQALKRILWTVDQHVKDYYGNTMLIGKGGHQSDWGGFYGALGEALYIVETLLLDNTLMGKAAFNAFLDESFPIDTTDGEHSLDGSGLSRRDAWERCLKANFDFARSRLSYIYNQIMYTYEGAWEAHEGLRIIDSQHYEGKKRSHAILLEALGGIPFLGEEVLVGPDGKDLDLYHDLSYHDGMARYTDDYQQIVMKGLAKSKLDAQGEVVRRLPYAHAFTGLTAAGLTRENGYVASYGEAANALPEYFYKTLDHKDDAALNDEILKLSLKSIHARSYTRHTSVDGGNRLMRMEMVLDERNPTYPGLPGYATRLSNGVAMLFASLEQRMKENQKRYAGKEWEPYWTYAGQAVGFVQQQLTDHQFFNNLPTSYNSDYRLAETYTYVTGERGSAKSVHPQTDFAYYTDAEIAALQVDPADYEQFAWADIDAMLVSVRDADTRIFAALNFRNRGYSGSGKLHVLHRDHENIVQIKTEGMYRTDDYFLRHDNIDLEFAEDALTKDALPAALRGEPLPMTRQPAVPVIRPSGDNDHAYCGYPDLLTARYGHYLFAINSTRKAYGNERIHKITVPGAPGTVLDLVSGKRLAVRGGKISLQPTSAVVLRLDPAQAATVPTASGVDFLTALPGAHGVELGWKPAAGAASYDVFRASREEGPYQRIASRIKGITFHDKGAVPGRTYYYKAAADHGAASFRAEAAYRSPASPRLQGSGWRDDRIGTADRGTATVRPGRKISITGSNGAGFGAGDDYLLLASEIRDSLHFVSRPLTGTATLQAQVEQSSGTLGGLLLRDDLNASSRYVYFGPDQTGTLIFRHRNRDDRHDFQDEQRSPVNATIPELTALDYPYLKVVSDGEAHRIDAYASRNGAFWIHAGAVFHAFPPTFAGGVAADAEAVFSGVRVTVTTQAALRPSAHVREDTVDLAWNKPRSVSSFTIHRSPNGEDNWQQLATDVLAPWYTDTRLRAAKAYYKIVGHCVDGMTISTDEPALALVENPQKAYDRARALTAADWTRGSFYRLGRELNAIKSLLAEPDVDRPALTLRIYAAVDALVSARQNKIDVLATATVLASHPSWANANPPEIAGTFAFDGDIDSAVDLVTRNDTWFRADFADKPVSVGQVRAYPRAKGDNPAKVNGAIVQGSNNLTDWTQIARLGGVDATAAPTWYTFASESRTSFRYIRYLGPMGSSSNIAELELYRYWVDHSMVETLLAEVTALNEADYTAVTWATVIQAADDARATSDGTQAQVDRAAADLLTALAALIKRD
ncbi:Tat pathway signal protein [Streptomyces sp. GbtcB7]|uniref:Tat pathway signal protein n=1 Tax=Streptomyces sp. GbtcB7 TaxID=2824752 RepID=UPI001C308997|nr:Tat pathway signal protein [Streptomyces sp. GbtcB7]